MSKLFELLQETAQKTKAYCSLEVEANGDSSVWTMRGTDAIVEASGEAEVVAKLSDYLAQTKNAVPPKTTKAEEVKTFIRGHLDDLTKRQLSVIMLMFADDEAGKLHTEFLDEMVNGVQPPMTVFP